MINEQNNRILCLDTSGDRCAVGIGCPARGIESEIVINRPNIHSEKLALAVRQAMENIALDWKDIAAVSLVIGPGSFTGLRIGMSLAKGLAFAGSIPLIGVSTLEVIAGGAMEEYKDGDKISVFMDARRNEYFFQSFGFSVERGLEELSRAEILPYDKIREKVTPETRIFLYGNAEEAGKLKNELGDNYTVRFSYPELKSLYTLSEKRRLHGQFDTIDEMVPLYLRSFAGVL
jgi:tRNA threonylcarbamoyladenosine biosynthesis protein TsaB